MQVLPAQKRVHQTFRSVGVLVLTLLSSTLLMPDSSTSVPSQKCIVPGKVTEAALVGLPQTQP